MTSSLLVIMTPGPDLALITRLVLGGTRRAAAAAAIGMIAAGAAQAALGAAGLAALLNTRPQLFTAFRWAGALVLVAWAVLALRSALRPPAPEAAAPGPAAERGPGVRLAFVQGLLCTGSNPKVGLFLMAFLPQFVPAGADPAAGVAVLAACYLAMGLGWLLVWMRLVHRLARFLHSPRATRFTHGLTAAVFGTFAVRLALGG
ncbi:LysE family transporter [Streptomyces sp. NPDC049555]|uniref:LysE family translocator n=1 Tax=Streptomyces sp. NPDC049555 TaxID=3154930 RepID=UPI00341A84BF